MNIKHLLFTVSTALLCLASLGACSNSDDSLPEPDKNVETGYNDDDDYGDDDDNASGNNDKNNNENGNTDLRYDTLTVTQFINEDFDGCVSVKGYIIGDCTKSFSYAEFEPPFTQPQALLIADRIDERSKENIVAIQLKSGSKIRKHMNLVDNPDWYCKQVVFCGYRETYLGMAGMKDISSYPLYFP